MSGHTAGKWRVGDAGKTVFGPPNGEPSPETIAACKTRANATLIASAPELLDILKRLTEKTERANEIQHNGVRVCAEDWAELYMLTNEARAAIAKAEGK